MTLREEQAYELLQHYPKFKLLELLKIIEKELEEEGIKTLFSDYHSMRTHREEIQKLLSCSIEKQVMISDKINKEKEEELNKFYDIIMNNMT